MEETFKLNHFALYSKHWYKRFNRNGKSEHKTIWDDLKKVMTADGYYGEVMTKMDMVSIIVNHSTRLKIHAFRDMLTMLVGITDCECWKYGYYTKTNCDWINKENIDDYPDYDYWEAIIYYCMSSVCNTEIKDLPMGFVKPDYKNCLPRRNGISDKDIKRFFPDVVVEKV